MLIAIWHMGTTGTLYEDPGAEFFTQLHPDRAKKRAIGQLADSPGTREAALAPVLCLRAVWRT